MRGTGHLYLMISFTPRPSVGARHWFIVLSSLSIAQFMLTKKIYYN